MVMTMRERCRVCNQRKKAEQMREHQVCVNCFDSWMKFSRMAVRGQ